MVQLVGGIDLVFDVEDVLVYLFVELLILLLLQLLLRQEHPHHPLDLLYLLDHDWRLLLGIYAVIDSHLLRA